MNAWERIALVALAYLLGSISFAWILAKHLKGVDLRTVGSGNLGATNATRVLGWRLGVVIYVLDFAKGLAPVMIAARVFHDPYAIVAGIAAILGHCFPAWHGLRGGKGVATASGVVVALTPLVAAIVFGTFAVAVLVTRRISAGSILAAAALPVAQAILREGGEATITLAVYAALAVFVIARHHKNVRRLLRGEEPRIGARPS